MDHHNSAITNAGESWPAGVAGPTPVTPPPALPLPKRSTTIKLSNPKTGEIVFLQSPDPVDAAEAAGVGRSTQLERPLTKRERKMMAKWEAEEKKRAEETEKAQKEAEEAERLRRAQVEETNPEWDEVRTLEEELRKLEEEMRKGGEEIERREEERREAEEDLMKLEEEHWFQRDNNKQVYEGLEEGKGKTKDEEDQRQRLAVEANGRCRTNNQEQDEEIKKLEEEVRKEEEELKRREEEWRKAQEEVRKLEEQHRIQLDRSEQARKEREEAEAKIKARKEQDHGLSNLEELGVEPGETVYKVGDPSSRLAGREQARGLGLAFAPSAFTSTELGAPPHNHESYVTPGRPQGQQMHSDVLAEKQKNSWGKASGSANHHTLNTISELSKQIDMLFEEMKHLKNEVRELRNETNSGNKRERNKVLRQPAPEESPQTEPFPSLPNVKFRLRKFLEPLQLSTSKPYELSIMRVLSLGFYSVDYSRRNFVTKEDELGFSPGDVVTILDAPQDMPRECLFGEINVTKRGFFPVSYVKLEQ
ncbi:hypothetical protein FRC00_007647 [Tulasnella sp. 408]|nr:hypothetical protein FRC00_007647 [Tulasnella sp. 408]